MGLVNIVEDIIKSFMADQRLLVYFTDDRQQNSHCVFHKNYQFNKNTFITFKPSKVNEFSSHSKMIFSQSEEFDHEVYIVNIIFRPLKNPILRSLVEERGYDIVMTESELNGPERFTSDRVATEQQCEALINLANVSVFIETLVE